jgi:hypothetical protein
MPRLRSALLVCLSLAATPAMARNDTNPPPSGEVIHLFGPDSIFNKVPGLGSSAPAAAPAASPAAPAATTTSATSAASAASAAASTEPATPDAAPAGPTLGGVLHQMFVTGDPNATPGQSFAKGRSAAP